jgi:hypothetical protein
MAQSPQSAKAQQQIYMFRYNVARSWLEHPLAGPLEGCDIASKTHLGTEVSIRHTSCSMSLNVVI